MWFKHHIQNFTASKACYISVDICATNIFSHPASSMRKVGFTKLAQLITHKHLCSVFSAFELSLPMFFDSEGPLFRSSNATA